ncbi:MAG TPA: hypothetical protein VLV83_06065 [Acidobacteriota bacterium]|nr:hypothetical protein [Acidobacteriota bacterium]
MRVFFLVLLFSALTLAASPQQSDLSDVVLEAAVEAHGGVSAISPTIDATSFGNQTFWAGQETLQRSLRLDTSGAFQMRMTLQAANRTPKVYVSDGRLAWSQEGDRTRSIAERQAANQPNPFNPVTGLLGAYLRNAFEPTYLGLERDGNVPYHRILLQLRDPDSSRVAQGRSVDRAYEVLIEDGTFLIAEVSVVGADWASHHPELWERWQYSDFRQVEGLIVPFFIEHFHNGVEISQTELSSFTLTQHGPIFREPVGN